MSRLVASQRAWLAPSWVREELSRKAQALPSLDLRFAESKSLTDAATGANLVTFTRASSGTYVGSDGLLKTATTNEARFDHNPTTGESLGLLVEESRTNLLLRSEELENASWTKQTNVSVTANQTVSPDGQITADLITWTSAANDTGIFQGITGQAASSAFTRSIWIRANSAGGTVGLTDSAFTQLETTVTLTTSWQRVFLTQNSSAGGGVGLWLRKKANSPDTIYLWGAQLEAGSFPTSYIPTTTATATRSADVASITGTNFSSWYRQDEGTVRVQGQLVGGAASTFPYMAALTGANKDTDLIGIPWTATSSVMRGIVVSGGSGSVDLNTGPSKVAGSNYAAALAASTTSANVSVDGFIASDDTTVVIPVITQLLIGQPARFQPTANTTIRRLTYWPARLANSTLQAITQ